MSIRRKPYSPRPRLIGLNSRRTFVLTIRNGCEPMGQSFSIWPVPVILSPSGTAIPSSNATSANTRPHVCVRIKKTLTMPTCCAGCVARPPRCKVRRPPDARGTPKSCQLTPRLMPRAQRLSQPAWRRSGRPYSQPRSACRMQTVPKPGYARAQEGAARSDPHCAGCEPVPGSCAFSPVSLIARHVTPVPCLAARP
jgi:hypothetical protein